MDRVRGKVVVAKLFKKFTTFCGTRKFSTVFIRARHWTLS